MRARLRLAGARTVSVIGNLKYDLTPDAAQLARGRAWRDALVRPVVLVASSREGEEGELLACWATLPAPRPLLLIVPRHPQRFDAVDALVREAGLSLRAAQPVGRHTASRCGPGRRVAGRLDGRDGAVLRLRRTWPCWVAALRRWVART